MYEAGARSQVSNYRLISVTSILCRIMERVGRKQTFDHLISQNVLSPDQHGFRPFKSTTTNLVESTLDWASHLDDRSSVDVLYFDLVKAFDSVVHTKFVLKLKSCGIADNLLRWFEEFLTDQCYRSMCVN